MLSSGGQRLHDKNVTLEHSLEGCSFPGMWQKEDWEMPVQTNSLNKVIEVEKRAACSGNWEFCIVRTMQDGKEGGWGQITKGPGYEVPCTRLQVL